MLRVVSAAGLAVSAILAGPQDSRPEFESVSVKEAPQDCQPRQRTLQTGLDFGCVQLHYVILYAYHLQPFQYAGPGWLDDRRYEITAKMAPGGDFSKMPEMLQRVLEERFRLGLRRQKKEVKGFNLVVGKDGPKLESSDVNAPVGAPSTTAPPFPGRGSVYTMGKKDSTVMGAVGVSIAVMARNISLLLGAPVADKTGLTGYYNYELEVAKEDAQNIVRRTEAPPDPVQASVEPGPSIFSAIQKLGLKLEPTRMMLETITVEHAEKTPLGN